MTSAADLESADRAQETSPEPQEECRLEVRYSQFGFLANVPSVNGSLLTRQQNLLMPALQSEVLRSISEADSMSKVSAILWSEVPELWYRSCDPLSGDIYSTFAFAVQNGSGREAGKTCTVRKSQRRNGYIGFICIVLIQLFAPPLLGLAWFSEARASQNGALWQFVLMKSLALFWMIAFILNAASCTIASNEDWKGSYRLMSWMQYRQGKRELRWYPLYLGKLVDLWVVGWTCCVIYVQLQRAQTAIDVVWDALNLTLLYNLDDIGSGTFGFVEEVDWPGKQLAWVYQEAKIEESEAIPDCPYMTKLLRSFEAAIVGAAVVIPLLFVVTDVIPAYHQAIMAIF